MFIVLWKCVYSLQLSLEPGLIGPKTVDDSLSMWLLPNILAQRFARKVKQY